MYVLNMPLNFIFSRCLAFTSHDQGLHRHAKYRMKGIVKIEIFFVIL